MFNPVIQPSPLPRRTPVCRGASTTPAYHRHHRRARVRRYQAARRRAWRDRHPSVRQARLSGPARPAQSGGVFLSDVARPRPAIRSPLAASARSIAARFSRSARSVDCSSAATFASTPLKEGRALRAPCLLRTRILRSDRVEQYAGEGFCIERVGSGRGDKLASCSTRFALSARVLSPSAFNSAS